MSKSDKNPNILFIYVDQLRADSLSVYGNKQIITPNLDELFSHSEIFGNHFCTFPLCTPSRYSMFSGQYGNEHSCVNNHCTLAKEIPTFPRILSQSGYKTECVGKMHFTPTYLDIGFQKMLLAEQDGDGRLEDDYHRFLMENNVVDGIDVSDQRREYRIQNNKEYFEGFGVKCSDLPEKYHSTTWITDNALSMLDNWNKDSPNFLMVSYIKPHHPFDPVKRFIDLYDDIEIELLDGYTEEVPPFDYEHNRGYFDNAKLTEERAKLMTKYYYALISQIDEGVGRLVKRLKTTGEYDNTLIIFSADHGDYLGFHHMALKQNHMYDSLMRIPLTIKYPYNETQTRCEYLSDNTQICNEILRLCNCREIPTATRDALHNDRGEVYALCRRQNLTRSYYSYMVRSRDYKLLIDDSLENRRLFDMNKDKLELTDLSGNPHYEGIKNELCNKLCNYFLFERQCVVRVDEKEKALISEEDTSDRKIKASDYYKKKKSENEF